MDPTDFVLTHEQKKALAAQKTPPASQPLASPKKRWHGWTYFAARIALATLFIIAGVDGFMQLIPQRAFTGDGQVVLESLASGNKVLWMVINTLQLVAGSMLLFGIFDVLAIFLLGPIVIGIVAFHAFYDQAGFPFSLFLIFLFIFTAWNLKEDPYTLKKLNFDDGLRQMWRKPKAKKLKTRTDAY